ncbi:MBL fold metallo-hydrolase [Treponema pallidum]|uniref:Uncharacterized protein TP_0404 n=4 Tax=Treponema pallidum TaxID=160 RepID=Y404_TREPA|nr:MBL fold metallo-hydrolase [Treponema pallidum]O83419.1 RecName: Full=Uncharacterized protein TP_0404 [Treponema pallidum subsp. pallidum str. Nichols]AAC65395.1 predicted coding region TP0404 [Treponema pallidum subsp. pallidum str. Nichols]ACD70830.1 hypothetical protein TPASS_0404 [Treponema pallidum subsp. pallidum SS14]ADD72529.1 conserved hypothetical protein [Treponema pallidum subsp. pallidum str. Chicago]AEZ57526.1 hypothetical protein TPESAMD_0404 [Treponema pallidum subsp. perten
MKVYIHPAEQHTQRTSYLLCNLSLNEALLIDAGHVSTHLIHTIEKNSCTLTAVFLTRTDDATQAGVRTLLRVYSPHIFCGEKCWNAHESTLLQGDCSLNCAGFTVTCFASPAYGCYLYRIAHLAFTGDLCSAGYEEAGNEADTILERACTAHETLILFHGHGPPSSYTRARTQRASH